MTEYNAANPKDIKRAQKAARQAAIAGAAVVKTIMATTEGRRWMWDELASCHIFATCFSSDALQMACLEGERNAGLKLLAQIMSHCPEQFTQAMRESNERSSTDTTRDPDAGPDTDTDDTPAE